MKFDHIKLYSLCILVGAVTGLITVPYRYLLVKMAALRDILFCTASFLDIAYHYNRGHVVRRHGYTFPGQKVPCHLG